LELSDSMGKLSGAQISLLTRERNAALISLALPKVSTGGAEIVNMTLAEQFLSRGFRVDIVAGRDDPESRFLVPPAARYVAFEATRSRNFLLPFARYLRSERPDVVIASMWPFTTTCVLARRLAGSATRMIVCEHNTLSLQYGDWGPAHRLMLKASVALTYPLAHARVAVSMGVADDLAALSGISRDSISVIYNPLSTRPEAATDGAEAEAVWGGWRGSRIITVGRFKAQKNHALLVRAFKKMLAVHDARLLILGTGELAEATAAVARAEGVAEKVLMPGATTDPTPYYRSADLFVLSSDREGFGNVIIEALACGVPVVSTNCRSGPSEILENGRYGHLVPVGDEIALARAMVESLSVRHDRATLKRRAAEFAPELIAEQYMKAFAKQRQSDFATNSIF
jgi:glycosyltransferase involved in cell wall biosynthesis